MYELADRIAGACAALHVGDPLDADTDVGTLIDGPAAELVSNRVRAAVAIGATLHAADSAAAPRSRKALLDEHASPSPSERLWAPAYAGNG